MDNIYNDVDLFFKQRNESILSIKKKYIGTSNTSYILKTNRDKYLLKILDNNLSMINNEFYVYKSLKINDSWIIGGKILIKKWLKGHMLFFITKKDTLKIIKKISILHSFDIKNINIKKIDLLKYSNNLNNDWQKILKKMINKNKNSDWCFSHCDLTKKNILKNKGNIEFIDYEWSMLAPSWFDLSYFIINNFRTLPKWMNKIIDIEKLVIVSLFSLSWCYAFQNNKKCKSLIKKYEKWVKRLLKKYH